MRSRKLGGESGLHQVPCDVLQQLHHISQVSFTPPVDPGIEPTAVCELWSQVTWLEYDEFAREEWRAR